jgi:hypothetical protein
MPNDNALHKFYTSRAWRDLAYMLKVQRGGRCERSGRVHSDFSQLIAHHKQELTEVNLHRPEIALNPDNIEIISFTEHNKEHRRFGHTKRVFIVYGSPLSGKTSLVRELMRAGDIVVDIDALWEAATFMTGGVKPNNCRFNIFALRDNLLDQIKTRYGQWCDAWIIGGYPDKLERENLAVKLGAELIYCEATREECLERLAASGKPASWAQYIDKWWERFSG